MIWAAGAAAAMVALALAAVPWLVRREETRWRRFRRAQGEPEVVARGVAARVGWPKFLPLGWMVFRRATNRWEPVPYLRRRRQWSGPEQESAPHARRRPRGGATAGRSHANRF